MAKVKYIPCDIYRRGISVFIGTYDELLQWSKSEFTEPKYEDFLKTMAETAPGGSADCHYDCGSCVVRVSKIPETPDEWNDLTHELLHATFYVLGYCGVNYIPGDTNEAYTYLHGWLVESALIAEGYEEI